MKLFVLQEISIKNTNNIIITSISVDLVTQTTV